MLRKIIILCISIIVPIIGAIGLGVYDYKVYYNANGDNGALYQSKYKDYVASEVVDVVGNRNYIKQTQDKINLYRLVHGYYYSDEPIYSTIIKNGDVELFYIDIYKDIVKYTKTATSEEKRIGLDVFVYSVNYEALKDLFNDPNVLPNNKKLVSNASYPTIAINIFPNEEYNEEESLIYTVDGASITFSLYNGDVVYSKSLNSTLTYSIYDYNSNPKLNSENSDYPYQVQYLLLNDYMTVTNVSDENDDKEGNNRDRFDDGGYIKINAFLNAGDTFYQYDITPEDNKIENMSLNIENIDLDSYNQGFSNNILDVKINGVLTYKQFIFRKYVWWQCLICIGVLGLVMTGFYFTFTYDERKEKNKLKSKK